VDFDQRLVNWLAEQFQKETGIDLRRERQAFQRLLEAAEKAKIELSSVKSTLVNLPFITATEEGPQHLETELSRSTFESLCGDLLDRLRLPVDQALSDSGLAPQDIDAVLLVGGGFALEAFLLPVLPKPVVFRPFLAVGEDLVGFADDFELFFGGFVAGVEVRVVAAGELAVGAFDFGEAGVAVHPQDLVIIAEITHGITSFHRPIPGDGAGCHPGGSRGGRTSALRLPAVVAGRGRAVPSVVLAGDR